MKRAIASTLAACFCAHSAYAEEAANKRGYSIFAPVPSALMREMTTDRPDITESPFTVDAGHIQIETQAFGYARSADIAGGHIDTYEFGTSNFRIGLTNKLELGIVAAPYGIARGGGGLILDDEGLGGIELRPKLNLWGNDTFGETSKTAFALMPFVVLPTDTDNGISPEKPEFGLIAPLAIELSDKFGLGMMATLESIPDEEGGGRHLESQATISLAVEWNDRLGTYYELAARFGGEDGDALVAGTGLTYALGPNAQLDAGVNFGLTDAADRFSPFVGLAVRY